MRVPIAYGLAFPERIASGAKLLDFASIGTLEFEAPDHARYPGLQLAWDTLAGPHGSTAVLNAANEEAVAAFLGGRIRFDQIHAVNAQTLAGVSPESGSAGSIEALLELDLRARRCAASFIQDLQGIRGHPPC